MPGSATQNLCLSLGAAVPTTPYAREPKLINDNACSLFRRLQFQNAAAMARFYFAWFNSVPIMGKERREEGGGASRRQENFMTGRQPAQRPHTTTINSGTFGGRRRAARNMVLRSDAVMDDTSIPHTLVIVEQPTGL